MYQIALSVWIGLGLLAMAFGLWINTPSKKKHK